MVEIVRDVYKGKKEEELKKMSLEEFSMLCKARARRAIKRALSGKNMKFQKLIEKVRKLKEKNHAKLKKGIKTHVRDAVILPEWLGLMFLVHNGKEWKPVKITLEKLGHRLGEYSHTTTFTKHSGPGVGATRGSKFISVK